MHNAISWVEKGILLLIGAATVWATGQEIYPIYHHGHVELKDLLTMFIFAEVIGMVGTFYSSHEIPIKFPMFIAITAISRAIILEDKEGTVINLDYQAFSILLLAVAAMVVSKLKLN